MTEAVYQNVLIVDGQTESTRAVLEVLARRNLRGQVARDSRGAGAKLEASLPAMVLVNMSADGDELAGLLARLRDKAPETPVVAYGPESPAAAIAALRGGCRDYLPLPLSAQALQKVLDAILPNHDVPLAAGEQQVQTLYQMAGQSPRFLETLRLAAKVAPTSLPVLITGESGTGKELISYYIHRKSRRANAPYVRVNCAALSESLLESELFGHERGAFTGACSRRKGRFERADGGTLLLDEISETGPRLQAELLRVLEQQDFERLGGSESIRVNVRIICTSNRDLAAEVEKGSFRRDLYYRIAGLRLTVPPLRHRRQDIPLLVWHFVNLYAREVHRGISELDQRMLDAFDRYGWPGNVRELRNVVRQALVLGDGPVLSVDSLGQLFGESAAAAAMSAEAQTLELGQLEKQAIFEALRRTNSHQAKAAGLLGITDRTLREKLRRYRADGEELESREMQWLQTR